MLRDLAEIPSRDLKDKFGQNPEIRLSRKRRKFIFLNLSNKKRRHERLQKKAFHSRHHPSYSRTTPQRARRRQQEIIILYITV